MTQTATVEAWQSSVIKLAQAGNLRAITFWLNHYLVPQGICAQVFQSPTDPADCLRIRLMCRRSPDCDRLMRFVCYRLHQLNSSLIASIRLTAEMVGRSGVLWEKTARLKAAASGPSSATARSAGSPQPANRKAAGKKHKAAAKAPAQKPKAAALPVQPAANLPLQESIAPPTPPSPTPPMSRSVRRPLNSGKPGQAAGLSHQLRIKTQVAAQQLAILPETAIHSASDTMSRSIRWLNRQTPRTRLLLVGGSAATAFLVGYGWDAIGQTSWLHTPSQQLASLRVSDVPGVQVGSVRAALESVPVIQQPVANSQDPTITLMFASSDTLGQAAGSATGQSGLAAYRQSDLLVTNLDRLGDRSGVAPADAVPAGTVPAGTVPAGASPTPPASPESLASPIGSSPTPTTSSVIGPSPDASPAAMPTDSPTPAAAIDEEYPEPQPLTSTTTIDSLLASGVDVVNVANDAMMQGGSDQLAQSLTLLQKSTIYPVGIGENQRHARRPQVFEVKGKKIAFLGYSDATQFSPDAKTGGINASVNAQMEADIKALRDQVDWIVVSYRWSKGLRAYPEDWQISLTRAAIDHGADLVIGYQPGLTQGAEIYNGRPIAYSLGDTVKEYADNPPGTYDTAALKVTIVGEQMRLEFVPVAVEQGTASLATGETKDKIMQAINEASSLFDQPLRPASVIDSRLRLSAPSAPQQELPTEPFLQEPPAPSSAP